MAHASSLLLETLRPLRRREYDRLVEMGAFDDERVELLAGVLTAMSPQGTEHADVVRALGRLLERILGDRAVVSLHSPLALSADSEPEPDVAVVPPGDYADEHPTTALLIIEVSDSSLRKDRGVKAPLYAAAGVAEYWIVDLVSRVVEVHRAPGPSGYSAVTRHARGATLSPLAFPEVTLEVSAFLREIKTAG